MNNEWLPRAGEAAEPKLLSDAIARGFDKARGHSGGREGRLAGTLINGFTPATDGVRKNPRVKKKVRIELTWVESRVTTSADDADVRLIKTSMRGYLVRETKNALVVASSIVDRRPQGPIVAIPKRSITKRIDG